MAPQLRTVPGVTEVNSFGGFAKQYQVLVHPEKLVKYGLTLREVMEAIEATTPTRGGVHRQGVGAGLHRRPGAILPSKDIETSC